MHSNNWFNEVTKDTLIRNQKTLYLPRWAANLGHKYYTKSWIRTHVFLFCWVGLKWVQWKFNNTDILSVLRHCYHWQKTPVEWTKVDLVGSANWCFLEQAQLERPTQVENATNDHFRNKQKNTFQKKLAISVSFRLFQTSLTRVLRVDLFSAGAKRWTQTLGRKN